MKKLLLFSTILFLCYPCYSQQILQLKSGEKMNGKMLSMKHDTIIFNFKGNKLKFASSEISAIYFDENNANGRGDDKNEIVQDAKLSGVITYFFNDNYGDKPDVGAIIYILDSTMVGEINIDLIRKFHYGASYYSMASSYKERNEDIPDGIKKGLVDSGVDTEEKYKQLNNDASHAFFLFVMKAKESTITADGNGSYSKTLTPGTYYVIIQSKHRQSLNVMEIEGVLYFNIIHLKNGDDKNISYNFPVN